MAVAHSNVAGLLKKHGYTEVKKVGEGSFGKAILVKDAEGAKTICKMIDVSRASRKEVDESVKEGKLLAQLSHPYIVRYRNSFAESGWQCILMDYCEGGDLTRQIKTAKTKRMPISEEQVLTWFTQAIMALKYLHDKHVLHRDLKPANFFLSNRAMKMGDFGIAKVLDCTMAAARTQIGTPYYLSPEVCREKPYAWPSDIWAMGCILYELCALKVPFDAPSISALVKGICNGPIPTVPSSYSSDVRQLCSKMLCRNADARPGSGDILDMSLIKPVVERLRSEPHEPQDAQPQAAPLLPGSNEEEGKAGNYKKGDLLEYYSGTHKQWLNAVAINVDSTGRVQIDLKPNTWMSRAEQAQNLRPRQSPEPSIPAAAAPSPRRSPSTPKLPSGRSPSPRHDASPSVRRSPSLGGQPVADAAREPQAAQRSPSVGSRLPRPGGEHRAYCGIYIGKERYFDGPKRWHAGQQCNCDGRCGPTNGCQCRDCYLASFASKPYRRGDLVEYHSASHGDWLPAVITNTNTDGKVVIDLKPNTWLGKEEQALKLRPRPKAARPGSRAASPMMRSPSAGAIRPVRASSRDVRAESPFLRARPPSAGARPASGGAPFQRPPGVPLASPQRQPSPLRQGGRNIVGAA